MKLESARKRGIRSQDCRARRSARRRSAFLPWHGACATIRRAKKRRGLRPAIHRGACKNGIRHELQMNFKTVENAADFTFVARRNNSLSSGGRFLVLGSLAVVVLAISLGFALNGAWLIFPFAGLDILVVYLAFRYVEQHAGDYECITFHDDNIVIESQRRGKTEQIRIQPALGAGHCSPRPAARSEAGCCCGRTAEKWRSAFT